MTLKQRIEQVCSRIENATRKSGRSRNAPQLLAVTKGVPQSKIEEALRCGLKLFGENRVEEAAAKVARYPEASWHMIGHLQSRKVKEALPLFELIHSVDSLKLVQLIDRQAANRRAAVLLQVNVSGEKAKYGFSEKDLWEILPQLEKYPRVEVKGLMTMAPVSPDPETSRPVFRRLREIFEEIGEKGAAFVKMETLSMGMSQDYEVAVEEGATLVRVGRALFGE